MNSRHNWESYSHQTLYEQIHARGGFFLPDGAGVSGAVGAQDGWADLASLTGRARSQTEAALTRAGAVWEGGAADAMRAGVTPLALWADELHQASTASQTGTDMHVVAYSAAKNGMPEPVAVTSTANSDFGGIPAGFTHLFGGQTDQDRQEIAAQEAKAEAVRVMAGYEAESGAAQASLGRFAPPPPVTVAVAPAQVSSGGEVIPVGGPVRPRGSRAGDDGERTSAASHGPGGGATPELVSAGTLPGATTASAAGVAPSVMGGPVVDQQRPGGPPLLGGGAGAFGGPGERVLPGVGGRSGGGFAEGHGAGTPSRAGAGGAGVPGRGAAPGGGRGVGAGGGFANGGLANGGLANDAVPGRVEGRGAGGAGMAPAGQRGGEDEGEEHQAAEYLRGPHDSFWDDSPAVAPSVIGDEVDG